MNGYAWSEHVRRVLWTGTEAARARQHEYVGPEHQLLGLLAEREGVASSVLDALAVDRTALAAQIDAAIGTGTAPQPPDVPLPHSTRARRVIELTMAAAREFDHGYVGAEHLLLGLLREETGIAAQALKHAGVTDDAVTAETRRQLGNAPATRVAAVAQTIIAMERAALERWGRGDPSGFLEISAPDVVYFDPFQERRLNGIVELRTLYESIRGTVSVARFELVDPQVQVNGDMAVLTFNYVAEGSNEVTSRWNCTEVYRRDANEWRIIQTHWSITQPSLAAT